MDQRTIQNLNEATLTLASVLSILAENRDGNRQWEIKKGGVSIAVMRTRKGVHVFVDSEGGGYGESPGSNEITLDELTSAVLMFLQDEGEVGALFSLLQVFSRLAQELGRENAILAAGIESFFNNDESLPTLRLSLEGAKVNLEVGTAYSDAPTRAFKCGYPLRVEDLCVVLDKLLG